MKNIIFKKFIDFLRNPAENTGIVNATEERFKTFFVLLSVDIPVMLALTLLIQLIDLTGLIDTSAHKLNDMLFEKSALVLFITAVIVMPAIEELIFRLYLRFNYNLPIQITLFFNKLFAKNPELENNLHMVWHRYYKFIFYFSAAIFAIVHIINYDYSLYVLLFLPILVLPQFVIGLFLGYIRVRINMLFAILFHMIHNLIFLGISFLAMQGSETLLEIDNEDYSISISKVLSSNTTAYYSSYDFDSLSVQSYKLADLAANINNINKNNLTFENEDLAEQTIDIEFTNKANMNSVDILNSTLQKLFNYEIIEETKTEEVWFIEIADFSLLEQHREYDKIETVSTEMPDSLIIENTSLSNLANILTSNFNKNIFCNIDNNHKYNFNLHRTDFNIFKADELGKYGLELRKTAKEIKKYKLVFHDE